MATSDREALLPPATAMAATVYGNTEPRRTLPQPQYQWQFVQPATQIVGGPAPVPPRPPPPTEPLAFAPSYAPPPQDFYGLPQPEPDQRRNTLPRQPYSAYQEPPVSSHKAVYGGYQAPPQPSLVTNSFGGAADAYNGGQRPASIPAPMTLERVSMRYEVVLHGIEVLIVLQAIFWFPIGLLYIECSGPVDRGRRHWVLACYFLTLALISQMVLGWFFWEDFLGLVFVPHVTFAIASLALGKELQGLENMLRVMDENAYRRVLGIEL